MILDVDNIKVKRICNECIGEKFLSNLVEGKGKRRKCAFCGVTGRTISVEELADRTEHVLEQFYQRTAQDPDNYQYALMKDKESSYEWLWDGDQIIYVIEDVASISAEAAKDVQAILEKRYYSRSAEEIGEETEYSEESYYEYVGVGSKAWEDKWKEFEKSLKAETRYFNQLGKNYLDDVFRGLTELKTKYGNPLKRVGPARNIKAAYRARVFFSDDELKAGLLDIVNELGPPPIHLAKSGRMNAVGISVFYGATDEQTALSEVRPPVGSRVVVARFNFTRELRLLNLIGLESLTVDGSLYDEAHADLLSRIQFLNQLSKKMTIPLMPGNEDTDYLITQAIADYLSVNKKLELDGIIFPSIQTDTGSNIVLFQKASRVAKREIPYGTEISVRLWEHDEDGPYPWFTLSEETPRDKVVQEQVMTENDHRNENLAIEERDIKIHYIQAVKFTTESHELNIDRHEKIDYEEIRKRVGF